jgi:hypothetical protein
VARSCDNGNELSGSVIGGMSLRAEWLLAYHEGLLHGVAEEHRPTSYPWSC